MEYWILTALVLVLVGMAAIAVRPDLPPAALEERYAPPPSQFLELNGLRVHYRDEGQGRPIVLLHGTFASLHTWDEWTRGLREEYRVIRLDLPGFGLTGPRPSGDYRLTSEVEFLQRFLDQLNLGRFHLAGNSLGGHLAWRYTLEHYDRVEGLTLLDSAGFRGWDQAPWIFRLARTVPLPTAATAITPRFLIRRALYYVYAARARVTPELVQLYFDLVRRQGNRAAFLQRVRVHEPSRFDELRDLEVPTLLIWGDTDRWIPLAIAQRFVRALPRARLVVIEDAGHLPMEERPTASLQPLRQFLRGGLQSVQSDCTR